MLSVAVLLSVACLLRVACILRVAVILSDAKNLLCLELMESRSFVASAPQDDGFVGVFVGVGVFVWLGVTCGWGKFPFVFLVFPPIHASGYAGEGLLVAAWVAVGQSV
jgi:hypothetical protein